MKYTELELRVIKLSVCTGIDFSRSIDADKLTRYQCFCLLSYMPYLDENTNKDRIYKEALEHIKSCYKTTDRDIIKFMKYIPDEYKIGLDDFFYIIVKECGLGVLEENIVLQTRKLMVRVIGNLISAHNIYNVLKYIDWKQLEQDKTPIDIASQMVFKYGWEIIEYIPYEIETEDACKTAYMMNPTAYKFISNKKLLPLTVDMLVKISNLHAFYEGRIFHIVEPSDINTYGQLDACTLRDDFNINCLPGSWLCEHKEKFRDYIRRNINNIPNFSVDVCSVYADEIIREYPHDFSFEPMCLKILNNPYSTSSLTVEDYKYILQQVGCFCVQYMPPRKDILLEALRIDPRSIEYMSNLSELDGVDIGDIFINDFILKENKDENNN